MLIGEGAHGCAFRPPLRCVGASDDHDPPVLGNAIGKVFRYSGAGADEEVSTAALASRFGAPKLIARCEVVPADAAGCLTVGTRLDQLLYEDVGRSSLSTVLAAPKKSIRWVDFEALLKGFADGVLGPMDAMRREGFVHMDIHAGNVVVGEGGSMRLIDFSWVRPLRNFWSPRSFLRFTLYEFAHAPPATPHSDWDPLAIRALRRLNEMLPPSHAPMLPEAAGFDPDGAGLLLWALVLRARPPPDSRAHVLETAALVAAGLTHPDVRVRVATAQDARRALVDSLAH